MSTGRNHPTRVKLREVRDTLASVAQDPHLFGLHRERAHWRLQELAAEVLALSLELGAELHEPVPPVEP